MGIDFGGIRAAEFDNTNIFYIRHPTRRLRVTRRPPIHKNSKMMTDILLCGDVWVIWFADFNNTIIFYVRRHARRPRVTRRQGWS